MYALLGKSSSLTLGAEVQIELFNKWYYIYAYMVVKCGVQVKLTYKNRKQIT